MRSLLIILVIVLATAAGLAFYLPRLVSEPEARRQATLTLERLTGRTVLIEGETRFAILPHPHLVLTGVRISDERGSLSPGALVVDEVSASLSLAPLFQGRIELGNLTLVNPQAKVLAAEILPFLATSQPFSGSGVSVRQVDIIDGALSIEDPETGGQALLHVPEAQLGMADRQAPALLSGTVDAGGRKLVLDARLSPQRPDGRRSFGLEIRSADLGAARLRTDLTIGANGDASGRLDLRADSAVGLLAALPAVGHLLPAADGPVVATASLAVTGRDFTVKQLAVRLPQALAEGEITGTLATPLSIQADLRMPSLALSGGSAIWPAVAPILGADLVGQIALRIGSLRIGERTVREVNLSLLPAQGAWLVEDFSLAAAGGANFQFAGQAVATAAGPSLSGEARLAAADLRSTLLSLGLDPGDTVPLDRLRLFSGGCRLQWSGSRLTIEGLDATIDSTHLTGGLTLLLRERPALGIGLTADTVNFDAYWGAGATKAARAASAGMDANFDIKVGNAVLAGEPLSDVAFRGRLEAGGLQVEALSARSGALAVSAKGTIDGLGEAPRIGGAEVSLRSSGRYAAPRSLGVTVGELVAGLDAFDAEMSLEGDHRRIRLAGQIASGNARLRVAGGFERPLQSDWGFDRLQLEATALPAERLAPLFAQTVRPMLERTGSVEATVMANGPGVTPDLRGEITAAGGTLAFDGTLDAGSPRWRGSIEATQAAPAAWLERLDPALAGVAPGELRLSSTAALDADALELSDLDLRVGQSQADGELRLSFATAPHRLTGRLHFADLRLPAGHIGPPWNDETLDSDGLRAVSLDLDLSADRLDLGGWMLGGARAGLAVDGGQFRLTRLEAGDEVDGLAGGVAGEALFGGGLALRTDERLELRLPPDALAPLVPAGLAGPIVADLALEARGRSLADLITRTQGRISFSGALDGSATVEAGRISSPALAYRTETAEGRLSGLLLDLSTLHQDLSAPAAAPPPATVVGGASAVAVPASP